MSLAAARAHPKTWCYIHKKMCKEKRGKKILPTILCPPCMRRSVGTHMGISAYTIVLCGAYRGGGVVIVDLENDVTAMTVMVMLVMMMVVVMMMLMVALCSGVLAAYVGVVMIRMMMMIMIMMGDDGDGCLVLRCAGRLRGCGLESRARQQGRHLLGLSDG
jgi:hypothetical protein